MLENCFPCGNISKPTLADIDYLEEIKVGTSWGSAHPGYYRDRQILGAGLGGRAVGLDLRF